MIIKMLVRSYVSFLLVYLCAAIGFAQNTSVSGIITDLQGAAIPGATLIITNKASNAIRTVVSSGDGTYQVPQVVPGTYRVRAEAKGFASIVDENVQVLVSTPLTLNLQFKQALKNTKQNE